MLADYDSSGGMFIKNGSTWELASINYEIADAWVSTNGVDNSGFYAAMMDFYGVYTNNGGCCGWAPVTSHNDVVGSFLHPRLGADIVDQQHPHQSPTAVFSASPTNGAGPLTVTFTDSSTGPITNRFWSFGDGGTTNFVNATNPTHTYTDGVYNVTLIVSGRGWVQHGHRGELDQRL